MPSTRFAQKNSPYSQKAQKKYLLALRVAQFARQAESRALRGAADYLAEEHIVQQKVALLVRRQLAVLPLVFFLPLQAQHAQLLTLFL